MATITLTGVTFGCTIESGVFRDIRTAFSNSKQSSEGLSSALGKLKNKIDLAAIGTNVNASQEHVKNAEKRETAKKSALSTAYEKLGVLIYDAVEVDKKVALKIKDLKEEFYRKYEKLKPECEKSIREKAVDALKKGWNGLCSIGNAIKNFVIDVVEWCKENWESLCQLIVAAVAIIVFVVVAVMSFGTAAVVIAAVVGAVVGICSQLIGDVASMVFNFAKTGKWKWEFSSWQEYLAAGIGGSIGQIVNLFFPGGGSVLTSKLMGKFVSNATEEMVTEYVGGHLTNLTGDISEKRTSMEILKATGKVGIESIKDTAVGEIYAKKGPSKIEKALSEKIPRLSGTGSYASSYNGKLTYWVNNKTKLTELTVVPLATVRNGIYSGLWDKSFDFIH